jgi:hypothetical protein
VGDPEPVLLLPEPLEWAPEFELDPESEEEPVPNQVTPVPELPELVPPCLGLAEGLLLAGRGSSLAAGLGAAIVGGYSGPAAAPIS